MMPCNSFTPRSIHSSIIPSQSQSVPSVSVRLNSQPQPQSATQGSFSQKVIPSGVLSDYSDTLTAPENPKNAPKPKDKGKEKEKPSLRLVKDEPQSASLDPTDATHGIINNTSNVRSF